MKLLSTILAGAIICLPLNVLGQEKCTETSALIKAEKAPCTGILWPESRSRVALSCLRVGLPTLENDLAKLKAETDAEIKALNNKLAATRKSLDLCEELVSTEVIRLPDPWWKHPAFWVTVGIVVGVGGTVAAFELSRR